MGVFISDIIIEMIMISLMNTLFWSAKSDHGQYSLINSCTSVYSEDEIV